MEDLLLYFLLLLLACSILNKYFIHKLKNLPPTPLSALTVIGYRSFFNQPIHRTLHHIAKRHGPILLLRFGVRRVLLISSWSAADDLFSKNDVHFANRPHLLPGEYFGCNYTNLAWAPHGDLWQDLRRVSCLEILPFYCRPSNRDTLADEVKLLLRRLFENQNKIVELKPMFQELVINVMSRMFIGKRCWGKTSMEESKSLHEYVIEAFRLTTDEPDLGFFMPILKLLGFTRGLERRCKDLQKKGDWIMDHIIKERRTNMPDVCEDSGENQKNVIEFLLKKQNDHPNLECYKHETIRGLVQVLMSAGTDTTARLLEWAVSLLLNHPEVLQKAQNEIDTYVGNKRFLDHSDTENLPYLSCIVKETLRMYPVAPLLVPHESSKECTVGGYNVPKGTMLMVNAWAIHNDPNIWDEPSMFKPERFEKIVREKDGCKLMPFGFGMRSCPGKHMAQSVITFALGSLIQSFNWERVGEKMVDMKEQTGLALFKAQPLEAICHQRPTMVNLLSQI